MLFLKKYNCSRGCITGYTTARINTAKAIKKIEIEMLFIPLITHIFRDFAGNFLNFGNHHRAVKLRTDTFLV